MYKNKAQCLKCGDVIESKHRYDFKSCKCGEIFVDGGIESSSAGAIDPKNFKSLKEPLVQIRDLGTI